MKRSLIALLTFGLVLTGSANQVNKRIRFQKGASSGTVTGKWYPDPSARGETFDRYILGASKGQRVTVEMKATGPASLYCWQTDYNNGDLASGSGKDATCSFKLPANGDFYVDVGPSETSEAFDYKVTVTIR